MPKDLERPPSSGEPKLDIWLLRLWKQFRGDEEAPEDTPLGDAGAVNAGDISHVSLSNLNSATYTHLTSTQANGLTSNNNTTLHYHSADRDRANHTGTQTASTISDFTAAVQAVAVSNNSVLEAQVFGP